MTKHLSPDRGPWKVFVDNDGTVCLFSDDFTHDVRMEIYGDFGSTENRIAYAEAFADWLNERLLNDDNKSQ